MSSIKAYQLSDRLGMLLKTLFFLTTESQKKIGLGSVGKMCRFSALLTNAHTCF